MHEKITFAPIPINKCSLAGRSALDLTRPAHAPFELLMALDLTNGVKVTFECLKPESLIVKTLNNNSSKKQKWDIINLFCQEIFHEFKHSVMDEIDTNSSRRHNFQVSLFDFPLIDFFVYVLTYLYVYMCLSVCVAGRKRRKDVAVNQNSLLISVFI